MGRHPWSESRAKAASSNPKARTTFAFFNQRAGVMGPPSGLVMVSMAGPRWIECW